MNDRIRRHDEEYEGMRIIDEDDELSAGRSVFGDDDWADDDEWVDDADAEAWDDDEESSPWAPPLDLRDAPATAVPGDSWEDDDDAWEDETANEGQAAWGESTADQLPHWTDPPTGRHDAMDDEGLAAAWGADEPRWSDDDELPPLEPVPTVGGYGEGDDDFFTYDDTGSYEDLARLGTDDYETAYPSDAGGPPSTGGRAPVTVGAPGHDRNMPMAIATGVGLAVIALVAFSISPAVSIVLITVLLGLAAVEFGMALTNAGYRPATLLMITGVVSASLAGYYKGDVAIGVVMFLFIVFGALWYLTEVGSEAPLMNLGVSLLGVVWIGVLGSFAGVMLRTPDGTGMVIAAIIATVAYDVGAFLVGRAAGRQPLTTVSPNKTVEGLVGGMIAAVLATTIIVGVIKIAPFGQDPGTLFDAVILGVIAGVVAPIGDLFESLLKRDLGIKDMGSVLPGHGGLLDRFDALLFVLPVTYYVARVTLYSVG